MPNEHNHHQHPGSISVSHASEATANWREYLTESGSEFNLRSFWISIDKIKSLLEHTPHADGLRVYLGLNDAADPTSFKFVAVPTHHGADVTELPNGKSNVVDDHSYCPPICMGGGVLNG